jgi:hypothetical protein
VEYYTDKKSISSRFLVHEADRWKLSSRAFDHTILPRKRIMLAPHKRFPGLNKFAATAVYVPTSSILKLGCFYLIMREGMVAEVQYGAVPCNQPAAPPIPPP